MLKTCSGRSLYKNSVETVERAESISLSVFYVSEGWENLADLQIKKLGVE